MEKLTKGFCEGRPQPWNDISFKMAFFECFRDGISSGWVVVIVNNSYGPLLTLPGPSR